MSAARIAAILQREKSVKPIVGVDLGGTKIATALATARGEILASDYRPTLAPEGQAAVVERIASAIREVMRRGNVSESDLLGIGIGAPGPCDHRTGVLGLAPNLPGWRNVPVKAIFESRFGVPVFLDNDANAAARAEHRFGAGRGTRHMIYVTISTGIGVGLILDGRLYAGADGAAAEVGHMTVDESGPRCNCGNVGCWEAMASGTALAREAGQRIDEGAATTIPHFAEASGGQITAQAVYQAACEGDAVAQELIARCAHYVGVGLLNLVHIFNPELIVIGGGMAQMGEMLLGPARRVLKERALEIPGRTVRLCPPALGDRAGVLGAVALVLTEIKHRG